MAIMMGCFRFAEDYTNTIFSMAIGIVVILCLKPIFEKYYPKPKGNFCVATTLLASLGISGST